jgi:glycosyltransferase involved in cell wall biosynthesis
MRFAIDAHTIGRHLTGNEVYVRNLLEHYARLDREAEFYAYVCSEYAASEVPNRFVKRSVSANPFLRLGLNLTQRVMADRPDVLHVQYTAPLVCPAPLVVSVHDVSYLERPEYFTRARQLQLKATVANTVKRAARVITVSEFSRQRIQAAYNIPGERIEVIHNAAAPYFRQVAPKEAMQTVGVKFGVQWPYVLSVGDLQPRKNQIGLIAAFEELMTHYPELPHHLMLVGKPTWFAPRVYEAARQSRHAERIHFTDFVSDDDLLNLYNAAELFVYPSFYEGFGLPILEAQACGCAVACSNTSAMPEVANSAALLFNPESREELVRAMRGLLMDGELRERMVRQGFKNIGRFSWEKAARQTLDVYYEVGGKPRRKARVNARVAQAVSKS